MRAILGQSEREGVTFLLGEQEEKKPNNNQRPSDFAPVEADLKHFLKEIQTLDLPEIKNQPQIQKIKRRIDAFSKQYGQKTQKTTAIFMNYLQTVREAGVNCLKNKQLLKSASYFAECLRFVDPKYDEIFYQKFLIVKVDALNKLMYCIFELQSIKNKDYFLKEKDYKKQNRYLNAQIVLTQFLDDLHDFQKIQSLRRSENCMLQVNYFYLGRLRRKNNSKVKAIESFKESLDILQSKMTGKTPIKNDEIRNFLKNLRVKIYYKLSKCYRQIKNIQMQNHYQQQALAQAQKIRNTKLECYIRRKIIFFDAKTKFLDKLSKLDGKRRIEEEVSHLIEQARQNEVKSLYNIYEFQPSS